MLIVQKFGGTSVGNIERIRNVACKVAKTRDEGHEVVVVVSAMSGETDRLMALAHEITNSPVEREMDLLLSSGERVTIALLAITLNSMGYPSKAFTGRQVVTRSASPLIMAAQLRTPRRQMGLRGAAGIIPVVA